MKVGVYAGSLRPGGGITALRQVLEGLLEMEGVQVTVFTGAADCSGAIQDLLERHDNLVEKPFHPNAGSFSRYLRSKVAFRRLGADFDWLFSVNYHLPAPCKVAVYHLNLLSFQRGPSDGLSAAMKRFDARVACRNAESNLFESQFLLDSANSQVGGGIVAPKLLYLGIHPAFFAGFAPHEGPNPGQLLLVSSMAAHKDNATALKTLELLVKQRPEVPWRLKVAGGQSKEQWASFSQQAKDFGVADSLEILGPMQRSQLSKLMGASLCLLNPSRIESFCMVALEAMASFCPAIVTSATSMPESVGDAAQIVSPGDFQAFAEAVLRHHDDGEFRNQAVARGRAHAESFGAVNFHRQLQEVIKP